MRKAYVWWTPPSCPIRKPGKKMGATSGTALRMTAAHAAAGARDGAQPRLRRRRLKRPRKQLHRDASHQHADQEHLRGISAQDQKGTHLEGEGSHREHPDDRSELDHCERDEQ